MSLREISHILYYLLTWIDREAIMIIKHVLGRQCGANLHQSLIKIQNFPSSRLIAIARLNNCLPYYLYIDKVRIDRFIPLPGVLNQWEKKTGVFSIWIYVV